MVEKILDVNLFFHLTRRIELAAFEPLELCLPHVALHHGVKVLEPVQLGAGDPAPKLLGLKNQESCKLRLGCCC